MPFPVVSRNEIRTRLAEVGVSKGDTIYMASFAAILGNSDKVLDECIDAVQEAMGTDGTLIMPAFNWDYCKGNQIFDPKETPSKVGTLTEIFRKRENVRRTLTPPWSTFCIWGKESETLEAMNARTPFGEDSILQYLYEVNAKYLLLGCSFNDGVVQVHWLEEKFQVPYRYWKEFKGFIRCGGATVENTSLMYARNLHINATIDPSFLTNQFESSASVRKTRLGLGFLKAFHTRDYVNFISPYLEKDPLVLLSADARERFHNQEMRIH